MSLFAFDQTIVVGNVGKDAEMRYMPDGRAVTNFTIAVDRSYKPQDATEYVKRTIWYRISVFGKFAEYCNTHVKKGTRLLVSGLLNPDWNTGGPKVYGRQDGTAGASYEIVADTVRFFSKSEGDGSVPYRAATESDDPERDDVGDLDTPF